MALPLKVGHFVQISTADRNGYSEEKQPYPRSGHCSVANNGHLVVYGGYHPEYRCSFEEDDEENISPEYIFNKVFKELWSFNLTTCEWHEVSTSGHPPAETASMSMAISGQTLLLFGGTGFPWGLNSNDKIYMFNLKTQAWNVLNSGGERPQGKYGQAMCLHQGCIYVFGGCRQVCPGEFHFNSELHELNLHTNMWTHLHENLPTDFSEDALCRGMYRHSIAIHKNKLFVIGNSWHELQYKSHFMNKIHAYDLGTRLWEYLSTRPWESIEHSYPKRRVYHTCCQWKDSIYMCGGHNSSYIYDDLWKLNLETLQWSKLSVSMPVPTFFHSAAITPAGCMYLYGGVTSLGDRVRTSAIFRIWLEVPSLLEIAWNYLHKYFSHLDKLSYMQLYRLGIPPALLDRLKPYNK
ncbi:kelch domain-containing protein 10-like [Anneissia japonica]|uniref:kelch domain-containing protein 10-like n=1 Tax=Anneissia japonica TaxID=1529436 RepID=UPI001425A399|nr:kelch domain-containing protein 10-like [Anneissia japonica]